MLLVSAFMLLFSSPAFASYNEPTLEDYQNVAKNIIQKYDMEEQMQYQLLAIPHDKNLEQYSNYIEGMATTMAEQYRLYPEAFDENNSISTEPENMLRVTPKNSVQPRIMMVTKKYTEYQNYAFWFMLSVNVIVKYNLDYPSYKWIDDAGQIFGSCSYAGTLAGYSFEQTTQRWSINNNGSAHCSADGMWKVTYKGQVEQMGMQRLEGDFGASRI